MKIVADVEPGAPLVEAQSQRVPRSIVAVDVSTGYELSGVVQQRADQQNSLVPVGHENRSAPVYGQAARTVDETGRRAGRPAVGLENASQFVDDADAVQPVRRPPVNNDELAARQLDGVHRMVDAVLEPDFADEFSATCELLQATDDGAGYENVLPVRRQRYAVR